MYKLVMDKRKGKRVTYEVEEADKEKLEDYLTSISTLGC